MTQGIFSVRESIEGISFLMRDIRIRESIEGISYL